MAFNQWTPQPALSYHGCFVYLPSRRITRGYVSLPQDAAAPKPTNGTLNSPANVQSIPHLHLEVGHALIKVLSTLVALHVGCSQQCSLYYYEGRQRCITH